MSSNRLMLFGFVAVLTVYFGSCNVIRQAESDYQNGGISLNFQQGMRDFVINGKGVGIQQTVVAFQATLTSGNIGPSYAHGAIKFNDVALNIGNGYDSSTGKFTAPIKGLYQFSTTYLQVNGYTSHVQLMKGNTVISDIHAIHKNHDQLTKTVLVALAKGETFWVKLSNSSGFAVYGLNRYTEFGGFLVSTTIQ